MGKKKHTGMSFDAYDLMLFGLFLIGLSYMLEKPDWYNIVFTLGIMVAHIFKIYVEQLPPR